MQTFRDVRERGCYYVDKTEQIRRLVENGKCYFLSRPRRFGKSLLVDTIKELFEGSEALFAGLDIHGHWDWSVQHPVVRLDLSGSFRTPEELEKRTCWTSSRTSPRKQASPWRRRPPRWACGV